MLAGGGRGGDRLQSERLPSHTAPMKFDLLYELQMPKPHDAWSEYRCYHEALAQIELADRLGFDTVWEVEHHFLTEFAHSSAPEVFLSAVAQRTKRIRIGHGVVLLPHKFNHPIRIAERVAALDILSDGRVEFGTGRSSQYEQAGFEVDTETSREMWQESLEMIPRMWTEDPFQHRGRFVTVPPRSIVPKPLQKPHPPIWMAATSPQSWEIAGRNGIGILGLTIFVSVPQLEDRVRAYRQALTQAKPVGRFVNDKVGAFTIVHVAETKAQCGRERRGGRRHQLPALRLPRLGGFADPSGRGMQRDYAELEIKSTPYRDLIAKEYDHRQDAAQRVHVRRPRPGGHGHRRGRRPLHTEDRAVPEGGARPLHRPAGGPHPA
jgi:alkanesulfonate monooxygenase SsuD/methylene tetrahydromethanopterin reductase-like flavin-dependent oxidoreductase (luciferase family)